MNNIFQCNQIDVIVYFIIIIVDVSPWVKWIRLECLRACSVYIFFNLDSANIQMDRGVILFWILILSLQPDDKGKHSLQTERFYLVTIKKIKRFSGWRLLEKYVFKAERKFCRKVYTYFSTKSFRNVRKKLIHFLDTIFQSVNFVWKKIIYYGIGK